MTTYPRLSVVLGTLDRLPLLQACVNSIRESAGDLWHEIIVVDGGSIDGTAEYLIAQQEFGLRPIWQGERLGAIAAFNAGFRAARGEYVANLNDDAICMGGVLQQACRILEQRQGVGQIALPFSDPRHPPAVHKVTVGTPPTQYLYANFGVTRRWLGEAVGWWGNGYHYGGDTELSLQVWKAGYSVFPLESKSQGFVRHYRAQDQTRIENYDEGRKLGRRWHSWNGQFEPIKPPEELTHGF